MRKGTPFDEVIGDIWEAVMQFIKLLLELIGNVSITTSYSGCHLEFNLHVR